MPVRQSLGAFDLRDNTGINTVCIPRFESDVTEILIGHWIIFMGFYSIYIGAEICFIYLQMTLDSR